jgi:hypothetical protein
MKSLATTQLLSGGTRDVVLGVGVSPRNPALKNSTSRGAAFFVNE